jgi:hypothetical protein
MAKRELPPWPNLAGADTCPVCGTVHHYPPLSPRTCPVHGHQLLWLPPGGYHCPTQGCGHVYQPSSDPPEYQHPDGDNPA